MHYPGVSTSQRKIWITTAPSTLEESTSSFLPPAATFKPLILSGGIRNVAVGGRISGPQLSCSWCQHYYRWVSIHSHSVIANSWPCHAAELWLFFLSFFCRSCAFAWLCRDELQLQPQCSVCGLCGGILLPMLGRVLIADMQDNREQPGNWQSVHCMHDWIYNTLANNPLYTSCFEANWARSLDTLYGW